MQSTAFVTVLQCNHVVHIFIRCHTYLEIYMHATSLKVNETP